MKAMISIAAFLVMLSATSVRAQELGFTEIIDRESFTFDGKGHWTGTRELVRQLLDAETVRRSGRIEVPYVATHQSIEIVEAATLKSDGKVIPVPADKIFDVSPRVSSDVALYTDVRIKSIVFSDVAAGDSVRYVYRRVQFDNPWGKYSGGIAWHPSIRSKLSERVFDHPAGMVLASEYHDGIQYRVERIGDRVREIFTWNNEQREPAEIGSTSEVDWARRFFISEFKSYSEIGDHYGKFHSAAAQATPAVEQLAQQIVGQTTERRAQARLLAEWVAKNIRYVAVTIGQGGLMPNKADETITNRYGDCKANVALLASLLAARGIASEPALMNIGVPHYGLSDTAVAAFNHVILYLPEFDVYVDPTSHFSAFGTLPWGHYDKPVLHAVVGKSHVARIPSARAEDNRADVFTAATVWPDGHITGRTREHATGAWASDLKNLSSEELDAAKAVVQLGSAGTPGSGQWITSSREPAAPEASLEGEFKLIDEIDLAGGEALLAPPGLRFLGRPGTYLLGLHNEVRKHPFPCYAGRQSETLEVTVPAGLKPTRLPSAREWRTSFAEYKSRYVFRDGVLFVQREFVAHPDGQVCTPEQSKELMTLQSNIRRDYKSVVVFDKSL